LKTKQVKSILGSYY